MNNRDLPAMPIELNGFGLYEPCAHLGLTKREQFALAAMQGILASGATYAGSTTNRHLLAADAVAHADALLALLETSK